MGSVSWWQWSWSKAWKTKAKKLIGINNERSSALLLLNLRKKEKKWWELLKIFWRFYRIFKVHLNQSTKIEEKKTHPWRWWSKLSLRTNRDNSLEKQKQSLRFLNEFKIFHHFSLILCIRQPRTSCMWFWVINRFLKQSPHFHLKSDFLLITRSTWDSRRL